jgi:ribosomal protein S18 acetylase RimI-like enzyme
LISGGNEVIIVKAELSDIDSIKKIADAHRNELGFVRRPALLEAIGRSEILVAKKNGSSVGFVEYRHRRDQQTTLHNIVVMSEYRYTGIGRKLFQALVKEAEERGKGYILLRCPEELASNKFYQALGLHLVELEPGKQRRLNIWRWEL